MNANDHDVIATKDSAHELDVWENYSKFVWSLDGEYSPGSVFLVIRRRRVIKTEIAGRSLKKEFDEIVLSPDGKLGIMDRTISRKKIA